MSMVVRDEGHQQTEEFIQYLLQKFHLTVCVFLGLNSKVTWSD